MTELPSPQPKFMPYLSVIPRRNPTQKTHSNIGHAKSAVVAKFGYNVAGASCDMQIFEYKGDGWEILYDIKKGDLEPPWREGEIAEKQRKKDAQMARENATARREAESEAKKTYEAIYDVAGYAVMSYRDYVAGYTEGYMKAREKYTTGRGSYG